MSSTSSSSSHSQPNPRTRQRIHKAPPPLDVPDIEDDAAERKRVLNVLAQRRYREKKRLARKGATQSKRSGAERSATTSISDDTIEEVVCTTQPEFVATNVIPDLADFDIGLTSWEGVFDNLPMPLIVDTFAGPDSQNVLLDPTMFTVATTSPSSSSSDIFSMTFSSPSSSLSSESPQPSISIDSYVMPNNNLSLIRAFHWIAGRIGATGELWQLDCNSPFNLGTATPAEQLPTAWRPTPLQVLKKHHPMIDFMPWPSVRERVIGVFDLPEKMRPPAAQGPMALVNFAFDFEDEAEGVRILGDDPCDPKAWEVGQVFFERWWFLFDRDVIANSNRLRKLRGAPVLRVKEL